MKSRGVSSIFWLQIRCSEKTCNLVAHCNYRGRDLGLGEKFEIQGGCNTCTCLGSRTVSCTENPLPCKCQYKNRFYGIGDSFEEACNTCTCRNDGNVRCTDQPCFCQYEGKRLKVGSTFTRGDSMDFRKREWGWNVSRKNIFRLAALRDSRHFKFFFHLNW